jgi:Kef-type K+ transport system membrane component KefB
MFSFVHPAITGVSVLQPAVQRAAEEGAPSHGVGITLLWIAIILVAAKAAGLVERFGQPSVLGELVMGVILGNLTLIGIGVFEQIQADQHIAFLAQLGVIVLLFQVGLETDVADMQKVGVRAFLVAIIGVVLPFVLGTYIVGPWLLPGLSTHAYLFLGATLTATSVGITARVFRDLGRLQDPEAHIILGAAVIDDVLGLVILAIVSAIVKEGDVSTLAVGHIILKAVLFLGAALLSSKYIAEALNKLFARSGGIGLKFTVAISMGLLFAYIAELMGLAPIVGAFAAGLVLDSRQFRHFFDNPEMVDEIQQCIEQSDTGLKQRVRQAMDTSEVQAVNECLERVDPELKDRFSEMVARPGSELRDQMCEVMNRHNVRHIEEVIEPISLFLVPIFFVTTGMAVSLEALFDIQIVLVALGITIAAILGKIVAGFAAGKVNKMIVGWGMVPRGEVGLIFAMTGKSLDVVSDEVFSVIIIMVIFSTLLPPPILSHMLKRNRGLGAGSGEGMTGPRLVERKLTREDIEEQITQADTGLQLAQSDLHGQDLSNLYLPEANLRGANLNGANLHGVILHRANLSQATLQQANLENSELAGANLRGANLRRADLRGADLRRTDLTSVVLRDARYDVYTRWPEGFRPEGAGARQEG